MFSASRIGTPEESRVPSVREKRAMIVIFVRAKTGETFIRSSAAPPWCAPRRKSSQSR
jgi:hypothetical protein